MATTVSASYLSPTAQIQKFFGIAADLLDSLMESTDSAFKRVTITKRDNSGNTRFYDVKDPNTGQIRRISELTYIEDVKTGDLYMNESMYVVAFKCVGVFVGMPFYTLGKMVWHAVKTPLEVGSIAQATLMKMQQLFSSGEYLGAAKENLFGAEQIYVALSTGLFEIGKSPFFGIGCMLAATYGVFKPYHARKFEALLENAWQQGCSYKEDLRNVPERPNENCWQAFVKDVLDCHTFYLAHCFQVRGNTGDRLVTVKAREKL